MINFHKFTWYSTKIKIKTKYKIITKKKYYCKPNTIKTLELFRNNQKNFQSHINHDKNNLKKLFSINNNEDNEKILNKHSSNTSINDEINIIDHIISEENLIDQNNILYTNIYESVSDPIIQNDINLEDTSLNYTCKNDINSEDTSINEKSKDYQINKILEMNF